MELPTDIPGVMQNAAKYFMTKGTKIPAFQREKIIEVMGPGVSPVDFVVRVAEALYAASDKLDKQGKEIAAQAANLAALNGWHGMSERGSKMVGAIKKKVGETSNQPDEDDPEPLENLVPAPPPPPAPPAPEEEPVTDPEVEENTPAQ